MKLQLFLIIISGIVILSSINSVSAHEDDTVEDRYEIILLDLENTYETVLSELKISHQLKIDEYRVMEQRDNTRHDEQVDELYALVAECEDTEQQYLTDLNEYKYGIDSPYTISDPIKINYLTELSNTNDKLELENKELKQSLSTSNSTLLEQTNIYLQTEIKSLNEYIREQNNLMVKIIDIFYTEDPR